MVRQAAPGEEPFWSIPSGRVEPGELAVEALVREVQEETGLAVEGPTLAFVLQLDNRRREPLHGRRGGTGEGYHATVWTFELARWEGRIAPNDPDGYVSDARFVPLGVALARLEQLEWQAVTVSYLRGAIPPGSVVLRRWHVDGSVEDLGRVEPSPPSCTL